MTLTEIRDELWRRAKGRCKMCNRFCPLEGDIYNRMHIHHDHKKGEISLDNGECLCHDCHLNNIHGDRQPKFGGWKNANS